MTRKSVKVIVDSKNFRLKQKADGVGNVTKNGMKVVADAYRDRLKYNYRKETHKSAYGRVAVYPQTSDKSMSQFLVTSPEPVSGIFSVGPKMGGMYTSADKNNNPSNYKSYMDIFQYQTKGYNGPKIRAFRLRKDRQGASPDGIWRVGKVKPKKFSEVTYREYQSGMLKSTAQISLKPLIEKEIKK